jgi:hypothetical protein
MWDEPEDTLPAYEFAVDKAWEYLADEAPDGMGWEAEDEQDHDGTFLFTFRDAGGYEFRTSVNPWTYWQDDEP